MIVHPAAVLRWRLPDRWARLILHNLPHATLTAIMFGLFASLAWPGETFANPSFREFARLASENAWMMLFFCAGLIGVVGLLPCHKMLRLASTVLLAGAHLTVAVLFYRGLPDGVSIGTAIFTYSILATNGLVLAYLRALL